jgi:hypothetical protein
MRPVWPALLALFVAAPALAGGDTVGIVDVDGPDTMMGLSMQVTRQVLDAARAQGLTVLTPDELRAKLDPRRYEALRKCGGDAACASQILEATGVTRVVLGALGRDEKNYLLRLWLIDVKRLEVIADVDRAVLIAARRFNRDVEQAVPPLLRGEREARGSLTIACAVPNAQVTINGEFAGVAPVTVNLRPGKYDVKVEKKKYLTVTRLVGVEANQKSTEQIQLLLKPGELPDEDVKPRGGQGDAQASAEGSAPLHLSAGFWVAGAATVAAGATALTFALLSKSADTALQKGYDPQTQVYAGTRQQALDAQRNALVANVAFGVTGAAAATTVVLLILDATHGPGGPVSVAPVVTPAGGGLVFGGRF